MNLKEFIKNSDLKPYGTLETLWAIVLTLIISSVITFIVLVVSMLFIAIVYNIMMELDLLTSGITVLYDMVVDFTKNYIIIAVTFIFFCSRSLKTYMKDHAGFISYGVSFTIAVVCAVVSIAFNALVLLHSFNLDGLSWFVYYFSSIVVICVMAYNLRDIVSGNFIKDRLLIAGLLLIFMICSAFILMNILEIKI
ncbi:hypothetical protein [Campylobacter sp. CCUG 57310]|uniref:hypothetical protein n=1 Tax=Campylobacter sp. CCUG 57310 TaxID=2517362 RepID=UPI001567A689|nr:hypothetical protein [Campylobacter sp. CCUG 57310]QKF91907.1 putative membrane protein [Campylobacter sp. CCUG 57310]